MLDDDRDVRHPGGGDRKNVFDRLLYGLLIKWFLFSLLAGGAAIELDHDIRMVELDPRDLKTLNEKGEERGRYFQAAESGGEFLRDREGRFSQDHAGTWKDGEVDAFIRQRSAQFP